MVDHSSVAQTIRYSHPVVLLAALYASFASLVRNPPIFLLRLLPIVAAVQIAHASACLGSSNNKTPSSGGKKKSRPATTKGKSEVGSGASVLPALLSLLLAALIGTPVMFAVMVLLGAPITSHLAHTALCAAHLSLLAGYPLIYSYDVQGSKWRGIFSLSLPIDEVYGGALGACLGAWLGAVPIPLDWDREWQKWPVTIIAGMYAGYAVGRLGGLALAGRVARFT
ncbi:Glycosylphosphatidylinositol (GPI) anchor assembly protein [Orbilia brochopaga]|uniref:Glycosylphosphatidylinositol (GPI) anchor assembly protein n=1 Tax=Orbilia brochopaga TaxID=3140254 RepID=A0AAV9TW36_9PEZI